MRGSVIKLLAVDMDGTCLDDRHRISEENMAALQAAAQAGICVVPTTGRTATCLPGQLREAPFFRYVISSNGAQVADLQKKESLFRAPIPRERAAELLKACGEIGLGLSVHAAHQFYIEGRRLYALGRLCYGEDARNARYCGSLEELLEKNGWDAEELQVFFFTEKKRKAARALLDAQGDLAVAYDRFYGEIYAANASKGSALAALREKLQLSRDQVACIGDGENDLSMFRQSGYTFAMGNAIPELQRQADVVLPDNNASGVAAAIREHILT